MAEGFTGEAVAFDWPAPAVARATFTRPDEMNTLSLAFIAELDRAVTVATEGGARSLILTGQGRAFCAGAHLTYFTDKASPLDSPLAIRDRYLVPIMRVFDRLEAAPYPVIAAINGFALGGGFELALACDFRIVAATARLGLPEVRVAAFPAAGGVQKLHRFVGRGKAMELILLGRQIPAGEAEQLGLASAVVEPDALMDRALALAADLGRGGRFAMAQAKANIHLSESLDARTARDFGLESLAVLAATPEWVEGMQAFVEKREPRFT